eukprot:SAG11_NODE_10101_length_855_cov_0.765873_1_plen_210_part_00
MSSAQLTTAETNTLLTTLAHQPAVHEPLQARSLAFKHMHDDVDDAFGARLAADVLPGLPHLHTLSLSGHGMTGVGVTALAAVLPPQMQFLQLWPHTAGAVGPEAGVAVARGLWPSAGTLRVLDLEKAGIGDRGAVALSELLHGGGQAVEIMWLNTNDIGDEGGRALVGVLPRLTKLRLLDLIMGNKLSEEVEAAVRAAAAELPKLKKLK